MFYFPGEIDFSVTPKIDGFQLMSALRVIREAWACYQIDQDTYDVILRVWGHMVVQTSQSKGRRMKTTTQRLSKKIF